MKRMDFNGMDGFSKAAFIITILALVVGFPGNILSFVTWSVGKRCKQLSASIYFRALAIVDWVILVLLAVELLWNTSQRPLNPETQNILCKLLSFASTATVRLSMWITVTLTIEKVLRLYMPFSFRNTKSNRRVHIMNIILVLISYAVSSPNLFFNWSKASDNIKIQTQCLPHPTQVAQNYYRFELLFSAIFFFTLPFVIMLICNILIFVKMRQRSENTVGNTCERRTKQRQTQLRHTSYQVLAVSAITFLTMLPNAVMRVWFYIYWRMDGQIYIPDYFLEIMMLLSALVYLNNAVNFVLYCLVGRAFRQDIADLFGCCGKRNRETSTETTDLQ